MRQGYCTEAFEPNRLHWDALGERARRLQAEFHSVVVHHAAFGLFDGNVSFGVDRETKTSEGSSLALSKRTRAVTVRKGRTVAGLSGGGPEVGRSVVVAPSVDGVAFLRSLRKRYGRDIKVALKLDVEGYEFALMRDLLVSGALCTIVSELFVEWHTGSIDWRQEGLPVEDKQMESVYKWLLRFAVNATGRYEHVPRISPHCRTQLLRWG